MKLISNFKQWYQKNHQYVNFKFMLFYAAWQPFMLAVMLLSGHTSFDSWTIFALNVCIGLGFAKDWRIEVNMHEYSDIVSDEVKHLFELLESEAKAVKIWQDRCISANRRRKRTEKKLKRAKIMYCYALCRHLELLHRQNHQPVVVLTKEQMQAYGEVPIRGISEAVERHALTGAVVPADKFMEGMLRYKKQGDEHDNQRDDIH